MNILSTLSKTTIKQARRVGRGIGSGAGGHTTGRGSKGDKVRGDTKLTFDGTKIKKSWIKRTPFLRGKHRTLPYHHSLSLTLSRIDRWFKVDDTVTREKLFKLAGFPSRLAKRKIKILSGATFSKKLNFEALDYSQNAKKQIIAAGGTIK
ncbi:MAG: uL15m family ribosomal protein [Candidatus Shapirobacteria bacterium]|jgi:large subunit ribosomal protein L15